MALEVLITLKNTHGLKFFGDKIRRLDPKKVQIIELAKAPQKEEPMDIEE